MLACVLIGSGCASLWHPATGDENAATVHNAQLRCGLLGDGPQCQARVASIDLRDVSPFGPEATRIEPGKRRFLVTCNYLVALIFTRFARVELELDIEARQQYYVVAPMVDGRCKPGIALTANGVALGAVIDEQDRLLPPLFLRF